MKLRFSTLATAALLAVSIPTLSNSAEARGLGGFGMHGGFGHVGGWGRPGWGSGWGWGWPVAAGFALGVAATAPWGYYGGYGYPGYYVGYPGYYGYGYYGGLGRCGYGGCSYNY